MSNKRLYLTGGLVQMKNNGFCANLSPCMGYVCGKKLGHDGECDFGQNKRC